MDIQDEVRIESNSDLEDKIERILEEIIGESELNEA